MTTFPGSPRNAPELADAFDEAMRLVIPDHAAVMALLSMKAVATGARNDPPEVSWACRGVVAAALRQVADSGHPQADRLRGLADGLEDSARARAVNS